MEVDDEMRIPPRTPARISFSSDLEQMLFLAPGLAGGGVVRERGLDLSTEATVLSEYCIGTPLVPQQVSLVMRRP